MLEPTKDLNSKSFRMLSLAVYLNRYLMSNAEGSSQQCLK
ncbi:hypothetical protein PATSB16_29330 [Pandoraea thiooxydans]|nr:hypothetical protein PATSB16_29330 [Pandoraea thiooxydans]